MTRSNLISEILNDHPESQTWIPVTAHPGRDITEQKRFEVRKVKPNAKYPIITPRTDNRLGYYRVNLESNIPFHRVIAEQFIENPKGFPTVEHTN
jgi:hypothetical protein